MVTEDTLHNHLTTEEDTQRVMVTEDTLHNHLTTEEDTKRVMVTEDTLHNHLTTKVTNKTTTEVTTNKKKMLARSSLNEMKKNTEKIILFFIFALKTGPNKLF